MMDMLFQQKIETDSIRQALVVAFAARPSLVRVVLLKDFIRNPSGPARPIHAEVVYTRGEFRTLVKLHVSPEFDEPDHLGFARQLSGLLGSALLIPDRGPSPYSWTLVDGVAPARRVELDAESMDNREEYRLARGASS